MATKYTLDSLRQDVRYALRMLRRSPGFTAVAVLSLALGTGANTAIFTLLNTLMLRALPVRQPDQLVEILNRYPGDPPVNAFSLGSYQHFRDANRVFADLTGMNLSRFHAQAQGREMETLEGACVVGNFFPFLGLRPALGRLLGPADDRMGDPASTVAVVSWQYWQSRFNLSPGILNKKIVLDDVPVTIVGVAPREFFGLQVGARPDVWVPLAAESMIHRPSRIGMGGLALIARLKPGVSIEEARADMSVLYRWTIEERTRDSRNPVLRQLKVQVEPASTGLFSELRGQFGKPLWLLMALVGLLLLITCTNVANMLLARGATRRREMAVRVSMGAGRFRLMRQVLTESLLLAGVGGALGVFLAFAGARGLLRLMLSGRPIIGLPPHIEIHIQPDGRVLLFTAAVTLLVGLLFGLAPAWNAFRAAPASSLRDAARSGQTRSTRVFGKALIVAQVGFSLVLMSAAALFVRHLANLEHLDLGFRRDHVLLVSLDASKSGYSGEMLAQAYENLLARLRAIPGVRSAALSAGTPISGAGASRLGTVEGHPERPEDRRYLTLNWVGPKYFETLGTPFLEGRDFNFQDRGRARVAIVNEAMARYYFPAGDPIGKHVTFDGDDQPYQIVGLVGDAKYYEIRERVPRTVYLNAFQLPGSASQFSLRTAVDAASIGGEVRRTVRDLLKTVSVAKITTLTEQVEASILPERLIATLSGCFAALGLVLAAIGLYGLLTYMVARRVHEIGIRMALGATRGAVTRMVVREALTMVCAGLGAGIPVALWGKTLADALIQDLPVSGALPVVLGAVAIVAVAILAAYLPARRAARVDPMVALRYE